MTDKNAYEQRLRAELAKRKAEIDEMQARADKAEAAARIFCLDEVKKLRKQQEEAEHKLEALKQSGGEAWKDMKAGLDQAWDDLGQAVKNAAVRF